jgi:hypothetical protein
MQASFSASGTPAQVNDSIRLQVVQARKHSPDSAAVLHAVRDEIAKHIAHAGPDDSVSVSASVTVSIQIKATEAPSAPQSAPQAFGIASEDDE